MNNTVDEKKKIRSVIIDDEPGNIITLKEMLKGYCPEVAVEGTAPDIANGYELIKSTRPDLVFLDIEMPFGNAFDLLDKLSPVEFEVVFVTAFNDYAIKAFKYAALDYILKPVNITELKEAVEKASLRLKEKSANSRVNFLLSNIKSENNRLQRIALPTGDGLAFKEVSHIMHLEAAGSYTWFYIKDSKKELVAKNLKDFEDMLPPSVFCRIHHSHIVNINYVKKYFKGRGGYVEMEDGTTVEVSVRKKEEFLRRYMG